MYCLRHLLLLTCTQGCLQTCQYDQYLGITKTCIPTKYTKVHVSITLNSRSTRQPVQFCPHFLPIFSHYVQPMLFHSPLVCSVLFHGMRPHLSHSFFLHGPFLSSSAKKDQQKQALQRVSGSRHLVINRGIKGEETRLGHIVHIMRWSHLISDLYIMHNYKTYAISPIPILCAPSLHVALLKIFSLDRHTSKG